MTRDQTLAIPTADPVVIRRAAGECLRRAPLDRKLRLLGVRASGLLDPKDVSDPEQVQQQLL